MVKGGGVVIFLVAFFFFSTISNGPFIHYLHISFLDAQKPGQETRNQDNNYPRPMIVTTDLSTCKDIYSDLQALRFLHKEVVLGQVQLAVQDNEQFFFLLVFKRFYTQPRECSLEIYFMRLEDEFFRNTY